MSLPVLPPGCPIAKAFSQFLGVPARAIKLLQVPLGASFDEVVKDVLGPALRASISFAPFLKVVRWFLAMCSRRVVDIVAL